MGQVIPFDHLGAVLRVDDPPNRGEQLSFTDLLERDLVGLEGSNTLTRLLEAKAANLMRPLALRVRCEVSRPYAEPSRHGSASAYYRCMRRAASPKR